MIIRIYRRYMIRDNSDVFHDTMERHNGENYGPITR